MTASRLCEHGRKLEPDHSKRCERLEAENKKLLQEVAALHEARDRGTARLKDPAAQAADEAAAFVKGARAPEQARAHPSVAALTEDIRKRKRDADELELVLARLEDQLESQLEEMPWKRLKHFRRRTNYEDLNTRHCHGIGLSTRPDEENYAQYIENTLQKGMKVRAISVFNQHSAGVRTGDSGTYLRCAKRLPASDTTWPPCYQMPPCQVRWEGDAAERVEKSRRHDGTREASRSAVPRGTTWVDWDDLEITDTGQAPAAQQPVAPAADPVLDLLLGPRVTNDVLLNIATFLTDPKDLRNLQLTSRRFAAKDTAAPTEARTGVVSSQPPPGSPGRSSRADQPHPEMLSIPEEAARRWVVACSDYERHWVPRRRRTIQELPCGRQIELLRGVRDTVDGTPIGTRWMQPPSGHGGCNPHRATPAHDPMSAEGWLGLMHQVLALRLPLAFDRVYGARFGQSDRPFDARDNTENAGGGVVPTFACKDHNALAAYKKDFGGRCLGLNRNRTRVTQRVDNGGTTTAASNRVMRSGRHFAAFTASSDAAGFHSMGCGVIRPHWNVEHETNDPDDAGTVRFYDATHGERVGLLLDLDTGCMTSWKPSSKDPATWTPTKHIVQRNIKGPMCWAVALRHLCTAHIEHGGAWRSAKVPCSIDAWTRPEYDV